MTGEKSSSRIGAARNGPISSLKKAYNINKIQSSYVSQGQSFVNNQNPNDLGDVSQENLQNQGPIGAIDFYKTSNPQSQNQLIQKENNPILNIGVKNDNPVQGNGDIRNDGILRVAPNLTYEEA